MTGWERVTAWLVVAVSVGLFVWSLRQTPCWTPGCVWGSALAGIALGLLWTPDDPTHGEGWPENDGGAPWL